MSCFRVVSVALLFSLIWQPGLLCGEPIPAANSRQFTGQTQDVQGVVVTESSDNKGNSYLSFGDGYPKQSFTVQYDRNLILHANELPNTAGREIVVNGLIQPDRYAPKIIIDDARQITVLPVNEDAALSKLPDTAQDRLLYEVAWHQILQREEFARIEAQAADFVKDETRGTDGLWLSNSFFEGLSRPDNTRAEGWRDAKLRFDRWRSKYPSSNVVNLAEAAFWIGYAWEARGTGYVDTVTAQGWRDFNTRLKTAARLLNRIPANDRRPAFYVSRQILATGRSWDKKDAFKVLAEAKQHYPELCDSYFAICNYLLPRWYGQTGEWESFLSEETSDNSPFHQELYARVVWAQSGFYKNSIFTESAASWPKTKAGFEVLIKKTPGSWWNLNAYAKFASLASDKATCRTLMAQIAGHEDMDIWHSWTNLKGLHQWLDTP